MMYRPELYIILTHTGTVGLICITSNSRRRLLLPARATRFINLENAALCKNCDCSFLVHPNQVKPVHGCGIRPWDVSNSRRSHISKRYESVAHVSSTARFAARTRPEIRIMKGETLIRDVWIESHQIILEGITIPEINSNLFAL
jgi:hypothetical protein